MRTITRTAFAFAGAVALVGGASMSASAATDTSGATVEVTAGALTISAPEGAVLSAAAPGALATATFGTTTVSDLTADEAGWATSVSVTDFIGTADPTNVISASLFQYTGGDATTTGTVTVANTSATVKTAADVVGNNTAEWGATIGLAIPADALADTYTATITSSVL